MKKSVTTVIFGGTGFIGTHLTQHLLREDLAQRIVLVDLLPPRNEPYCQTLRQGLATGQVKYVRWDVRQPVPHSLLPADADLIFNLAAIHREPGHMPSEYFETNLCGAENVCRYAASIQCSRVVFTSSIAPYGPSEYPKDENSIPVPETPYGSSKLAAEKIHLAWQAGSVDRKLLLLRPGVVFGPGEGGNVSRLIRSLVKRYFVYMGNRDTRKAGGYVKELCYVVQFGIEHQDRTGEEVTLVNFSMNPPPPLESFVSAIQEAAGINRSPMTLPRSLLLAISYLADAFTRPLGITQPVSSVRVRKLFRSTWIEPRRLDDLGYSWKFTLEEAFRDWKLDSPLDFSA